MASCNNQTFRQATLLESKTIVHCRQNRNHNLDSSALQAEAALTDPKVHRYLEDFYAREAGYRKAMFYPPFALLAGIMVLGRDAGAAARLAGTQSQRETARGHSSRGRSYLSTSAKNPAVPRGVFDIHA